jgi:alpha-glucosidase
MADPPTIRVRKLHHRLTALAADTLRLQVASRPTGFTNDSWSVVTRELDPNRPKAKADGNHLTLKTSGLCATIESHAPTLNIADAAGWPVLTINDLRAGKDGSGFGFPIEAEDLVYGLGQGTGSLNRKDTRKDIWNIDILGHASCIHPGLRTLYQSIPFGILVRHGRAVGLFWDYPGHQTWDFTDSRLNAYSPNQALDLYIFTGPTLADILRRYAQLTGRAALPPRWALGYQQSRYSYGSRTELEAVGREFRERQIPCDVLHLDIDHMDGYRVFTFGDSFPKPRAMLKQLAADGFKVAAIADPGVKNDKSFPVLKRGRAKDAFVKRKSSRADYIGKVWPGLSRFPDFMNQKTRTWWSREQAKHQRLGLAGIWNDMTEPAIFDGPGKTLPEDCRHQTDFGPRKHATVHNAYGLLMAQAAYDGSLLALSNRRPFIVSRGGHSGIQRHAAVWTGDNSSSWEHLAESIPMLLNLGLSGVPFCGSDVGGFLEDCTGELLIRWTQLGAFTPFFRNHTNTGTRAQEPWAFGEEVEDICRSFISLRYQLLPYLYSCFAEASCSGAPIMRPLAWHYTNDPVATKCSDQFLLGRDLLLAPILGKDATARSVYLPAGLWFDFWTGEAYEGRQHIVQAAELETCPLFLRGGAIVPMAAPRQSIDPAIPDAEINLHVWLSGRGEFTWYEDDGESLAHREGGFSRRKIEVADLDDFGFLRFGAAEGRQASDVKVWQVILHGMADEFIFTVNHQRFDAGFDPETGVGSFLIENLPDEFTIRWQ